MHAGDGVSIRDGTLVLGHRKNVRSLVVTPIERGIFKLMTEGIRRLAGSKGREIPFIITTHTQSDDDGVGSVFAMYTALKEMGVDARVVLDEPFIKARPLYERLGLAKILSDPETLGRGRLIVLDTPTSKRLPRSLGLEERSRVRAFFVLDHHKRVGKNLRGTAEIINTSATSTCEMLFYLMGENFFRRNPEAAFAVTIGALSDARYRILDPDQRMSGRFDRMIALSGTSIKEIEHYVNPPLPEEYQTAVDAAVSRAVTERVGTITVMLSTIPLAAQSIVASRLILESGADIVIVASTDHGHVRTSVKNQIPDINMAEIMAKVGRSFGGDGGGGQHDAGCSTQGVKPERLFERFLEVIRREAALA